MRMFLAAVVGASIAITPSLASAQSPIGLGDLVGARGSSFEGEMQSRGYSFVKKDSEAQYWWNANIRQCVAATIFDGRVDTLNGQASSMCGQGGNSNARSATRAPAGQTITGQATCKLTNTAAHATLFEGGCSVTQKPGYAGSTIFEVHMANGSPFLFAGKRGDPNWMHGAEKVHFTDLPNGGIFHWSSFVLVVAE